MWELQIFHLLDICLRNISKWLLRNIKTILRNKGVTSIYFLITSMQIKLSKLVRVMIHYLWVMNYYSLKCQKALDWPSIDLINTSTCFVHFLLLFAKIVAVFIFTRRLWRRKTLFETIYEIYKYRWFNFRKTFAQTWTHLKPG